MDTMSNVQQADRMTAELHHLIENTETSALEFRSFFVAWDGVLVAAYNAFTPALQLLKDSINANNEIVLQAENHGSRWPKTTLGAIKDDHPPLSLSELKMLREICITQSAAMDHRPVQVDSLDLVDFESRNLEKVVNKVHFDLSTVNVSASTEVSDASKAVVEQVLSEFFGSTDEEYLPCVKANRNRYSSYSQRQNGSTLVHLLNMEFAAQMRAFKSAIDLAFPGKYCWFAEDSLHITVRGLDPPI
ncbi:hypothetical protein SARC_02175 [Sphaeroforma arctica JP610]|uniref:Uncharacterized protein n=1 Tax=Sphaeroforma arctica JP610 TaxID=667725 RepID=A0A0L0G9S4_9EUKA|nr:hypothetical protein SARC_02175 [Sphaeroforma arctica JP610]KNC85654.1 hypothetical protein SARC_02175 [Sphaeroforma arctica JP610]|eukprot:XP_014159556.1 hypothetical protein SARC_02175 [Sphaeroforma arctica JP610]